MASKPWRFYVYELFDAERVAYVGKGSTRRLTAQKKKFSLDGREVARFKREKDAYSFERVRIAESKPYLNKHPGGNGSRATPRRAPREFVESVRETRIRAAKFLLSRMPFFSMTEDQFTRYRLVANGYF